MIGWFHGGVPGLKPGDLILPPDVTGTARRLSAAAETLGAPHGTRTDVVYIARNDQHARVYAAFYPNGALYRVEPTTPVELDPDAPDHSVMAEAAEVIEVLRARVELAHRRPESWLHLLVKENIR